MSDKRIVDFAEPEVMGALIGINEHVKRIADVMEAQFVQELTGFPYIPGDKWQKPLWKDIPTLQYSTRWEEKDGKLHKVYGRYNS